MINQSKIEDYKKDKYINYITNNFIILINNQLKAQAVLQNTTTKIKFPTDLMWQEILIKANNNSDYNSEIMNNVLINNYSEMLNLIKQYYDKQNIYIHITELHADKLDLDKVNESADYMNKSKDDNLEYNINNKKNSEQYSAIKELNDYQNNISDKKKNLFEKIKYFLGMHNSSESLINQQIMEFRWK